MLNVEDKRITGTTNLSNGKDTYLDKDNLSNVVNTLNHEIAHQNGQGEKSSETMGAIGSLAFNLGAWANSSAISSAQNQVSAAPIIVGYNDNNAQRALLNQNNTSLAIQQAIGDVFEDRQPSLARRNSIATQVGKSTTTHSSIVFNADKTTGLSSKTIEEDLRIAGKCQTESECKNQALRLNADSKKTYFIASTQDSVRLQAQVLLAQLGTDFTQLVKQSPEMQEEINRLLVQGKNEVAIDISELSNIATGLGFLKQYQEAGVSKPNSMVGAIVDAHNVVKAGKLGEAIDKDSLAYPQDMAADDTKTVSTNNQIGAGVNIALAALTIADVALIGKHGITAFKAMQAEKVAAQAEQKAAKSKIVGDEPYIHNQESFIHLKNVVADARSSLSLESQSSGNFGAATIRIDGKIPVDVKAFSQYGNSASSQKQGYVSLPHTESERILKPLITGSVPRQFDTEYKILEDFAQQYKNTPQINGRIDLYTERAPCKSCTNVIQKQFNQLFPNVKVDVYHNNGALTRYEGGSVIIIQSNTSNPGKFPMVPPNQP